MKKNICFLVGDITKVGGIERVSTTVANALATLEKKYNVFIFSISKINEATFFDIQPNIEVHYLLERPARYKKDYFKIVKSLRHFIKQKNIDVMIDVDIMLDMFSVFAKWNLPCRLISWEQFNYNENLGTSVMDFSRKLASQFSDYIVVLTEGDKLAFQKNLTIKGEISCIYNPVMFKASTTPYAKDSKTILSVGRLTSQKGFDMLIEVANQLFKKHPDYKWLILGEGEDKEMLQQKITHYQLEDKVLLLGNVTDVETYYSQASVFVLTSRFEGIGLVLLEAKMHHLPVVSFNCQFGPAEVIKNKINGDLIDCFDKEMMVLKLSELLDNDEKRNKYASQATIDMDKFTIENVVRSWEKVIDQLC